MGEEKELDVHEIVQFLPVTFSISNSIGEALGKSVGSTTCALLTVVLSLTARTGLIHHIFILV